MYIVYVVYVVCIYVYDYNRGLYRKVRTLGPLVHCFGRYLVGSYVFLVCVCSNHLTARQASNGIDDVDASHRHTVCRDTPSADDRASRV